MIISNRQMDYEIYLGNINMICNNYRTIKAKILGKSLCGRNIYYFNVGAKQDQTLYVGGVHGMEWITSIILFKFLDGLLNSFKTGNLLDGIDVKYFLKIRGLTIIPCLNPDGVEIQINGSKSAGKYKELVDEVSKGNTKHWQANARGVDLNHNFNASWEDLKKLEIKSGIEKPAATRFGGIRPESEPESKLLTNFCRKNNFNKAIAFHSQGEEIYWDFGKNKPKKSKIIAKIFARSSGYKLSSPEKLATGGGFKDWFIEEFNKPAFTVEVGLGKNPLPIEHVEKIYNQIKEMLVLGFIL